MTRSALCLAVLAFAATFNAAPGGAETRPITGEVVHGWRMADGTQVTALKLTLAPGWKTYWRSPGDAGIPPLFDWSGSDNLKAVAISWPTPKVFEQSGMRSIGYEGNVVIPLHVTPNRSDKPVRLTARMDLGVCSDICVPERLDFNAVLDADTTNPTPVVAAALAARPLSAGEAGVQAATCSLRPTDGGIEITAHLTLPHTGGAEVVVIEAGQADIWVSEADASRSGAVLSAQADMSANGKAMALNRSAIRFTVLGRDMAVDIRGCSAG